ncbi:hypothetical protein A0H81_03015 [Grifola frondosa]|uniref:Uncharacterized protein n=1 Tax=Grifola frondosa TaxID=5627 RepID=A0A1C7MIS8_GRIFR|nr:hypothetical protein A0H81_03015 [Grifola frondosa]
MEQTVQDTLQEAEKYTTPAADPSSHLIILLRDPADLPAYSLLLTMSIQHCISNPHSLWRWNGAARRRKTPLVLGIKTYSTRQVLRPRFREAGSPEVAEYDGRDRYMSGPMSSIPPLR